MPKPAAPHAVDPSGIRGIEPAPAGSYTQAFLRRRSRRHLAAERSPAPESAITPFSSLWRRARQDPTPSSTPTPHADRRLSQRTRPADEEGFDIPRRYFAAAAILIGVLMSALDSSIVNIALPTISADLGVSAASVIWVANGYQVASAAAMLTCASLGSRIGERRFYTAGLALFTIASLGCALAPSFLVLVAMRILQGLSYAVLISVGYGMYRVIFRRDRWAPSSA